MSNKSYTAGVCNLGQPEINQRRRIGKIGLLLSIIGFFVFFGLVLLYDLHPVLGIILVIPGVMASIGFVQAKEQFCVAYALNNVHAMGGLGVTTKIDNIAEIKQNRNKAFRLISRSLLYSLMFSFTSIIITVLVKAVLN